MFALLLVVGTRSSLVFLSRKLCGTRILGQFKSSFGSTLENLRKSVSLGFVFRFSQVCQGVRPLSEGQISTRSGRPKVQRMSQYCAEVHFPKVDTCSSKVEKSVRKIKHCV